MTARHSRFSDLASLYPEFWVWPICAAAWLALIDMQIGSPFTSHVPMLCNHVASSRPPVFAKINSSTVSLFATAALHWIIMLFAMMVPLLAGDLRLVAARSFWHRRHRAMVAFFAGYLVVWLLCALPVEILLSIQRSSWPQDSLMLLITTVALAAVWQFLPLKRLALAGCQRTAPLAPSGWRADRDCLAHGAGIGGNCVLSCWALMMVCAVAGHTLWAILLTGGIIWWERGDRPTWKIQRNLYTAFAGLGWKRARRFAS